MDINHVIEPERQGLWIAVTFIVALLALSLAFAALKRTNSVLIGTQAEVLFLTKKIQKLEAANGKAPATPPAAAEAPAAK